MIAADRRTQRIRLRLNFFIDFGLVGRQGPSLNAARPLLEVLQTENWVPGDIGRLASFYDFVALELRELCKRVAAAGKSLPEPGFELTNQDGEIIAAAGLAWPAVKIAVLTQDEAPGSSEFTAAGWRLFEAGAVIVDPDVLVPLLPDEAKP